MEKDKPSTVVVQSDSKSFYLVNRIVGALWLTYVLVFSWLSIRQHEAALSTGLSLALYDHYVWNLASGYFLRNSIVEGGIELWNYYFSPILGVLIPLYVIWPMARILLVFQTVAIASSVFPIYWYARRRLDVRLALALVVSFFLYPPVEFVNLDQFNAIGLSIPLFSLALYFLMTHRYVPYLVSCFLLAMVKEEAVFGVIGLALYTIIVQRKYRLGLGILVASVAWLWILIYLIFPLIFGRPYFATRTALALGHLGNDGLEVITIFLHQFDQVLSKVFSVYVLQFVLQFMWPLIFLPLLGVDVMLIALPVVAMIALTGTPWITTHYASLPIACMYFGAISGLARLAVWWKRWGLKESMWRALAFILVLSLGLVVYRYNAPGPGGGNFDHSRFDDSNYATLERIVRSVPSQAVVVAQEELLSHFSGRRYVYSFPAVPDYRQADYLVGRRDLFFFDFHKARWEEWLSSGYFEIVFDKDGWFLAKRREPYSNLTVRFGQDLKFVGFLLEPDSPWQGGQTVRPIVTWQALQPIGERYTIVVQIVDQRGHVWASSTGEPQGGAAPTLRWEVGRIVGDQYLLNLPHTMPTSDYQLVLEVHRPDNSYVEIFDSEDRSLGTGLILSTVHIEKSKASVLASELPIGKRLYVDMSEIRLLGFEMPRQNYQAGDVIQLGLYWRARAQPRGDYLVILQLLDPTGQVVLQTQSQPAYGTYPTRLWTVGEVLLDWHDLQIPSEMSNGQFTLRVILRDTINDEVLGKADLAMVMVQ